MTASKREAFGISSGRRACLDPQVLLAELEDDAVLQDRRPHGTASDHQVTEPAVQLRLMHDFVGKRIDLPNAAAAGLACPDGSVREHEPAGGRREPVQDASSQRVDTGDAVTASQPERPVSVSRSTPVRSGRVSADIEPSRDLAAMSVDPDDLLAHVL